MKCPKCGYLGFEAVERCRNCGYDFSLAAPPIPELPMRPASSDGPLQDLALSAPDGRETTAMRPHAPVANDQRDDMELPLFGGSDDTPLITRPSPPRPPLAVRRSTPEVPRLRTESRPSLLDQAGRDDEPPTLWRPAPAAAAPTPSASRGAPAAPARAVPRAPADVAAAVDGAGLVARTLAGIVDLSILLVVDAIVVYFTLQIIGLSLAELELLPKAPLLTFLALQNFSYLAAFTAGGQTLGKMVAGIQVVADATGHAPTVPQALLRTLLWSVLALPVGLGLVSVLLDADKRGLHDRFARTRVIRAAS